MDKNLTTKVQLLVGENRLSEALDCLINEERQPGDRKKNALLLLKGKLSLLEEQQLAGMLSFDELARQKAAIAHKILDIADGSSLDHELPLPPRQPEVLVQKTVSAPAGSAVWVKYLLGGLGLLTAAFLVFKAVGSKPADETTKERTEQSSPEQPAADNSLTTTAAGGKLQVHDFPNLKRPFNFLDFGMEFAWAEAEWISDSEIRLKIRYYLTCKSNMGVCYRATIRAYADGKPYAPAEQSNLDGWIAKDATASDDVAFVFPADAKEWLVEFSRDHSTWKRPFKILR